MENKSIIKQQNDTNKRIRYDNIDLLKFIAIFMVITLHIPLYATNFMETNNYINTIQYFIRLISEGVLIFIMINGFLLINKPFDLKKHIKKILKLFLLILFWGAVYVIIKSLIRNEEISLLKIIKEILSINIVHPYCGLLWFLQSLLSLYIFFPIIKYIHDNNKNIYNYFAIIVAFFSVGINFLNIIFELIGNIANISSLPSLVLNNFNRINPFTNNMFLFYFMLGGYIFEYKDIFKVRKKRIISIFLGILAWIIAFFIGFFMSKMINKTYTDNYNYNQIFMTFTIVGLFAFSTIYTNKENILNKFITSVGKNTMGIYLIHNLIIALIYRYINIYSLNFGQRFGFTCITLLVSWGLSVIIMKIPKVNSLFKT